MGWKEEMTDGVLADIKRERERQKEVEGWTPEHDATHVHGELSAAAACYALHAFNNLDRETIDNIWPWERSWWKPKKVRRDLVRAAALLIAEIERFDIELIETLGPRVAVNDSR